MAQCICVRKNSYYDSVTLMTLTNELKKSESVNDAIVSMATDMNKELAESIGLFDESVANATANDLIVAIDAASEEECDAAIARVDELLQSRRKKGKRSSDATYRSIGQAVGEEEGLNIAVISVAGAYAAREVDAALDNGLNVMLFSDNVSLEDEITLKQKAHDLGLLVMGPDCGTAIIDGVGLCFANDVKRGSVGIVAASGTGLQEVSVLVDRFGEGISQAIGTGGRDLSAQVGGIMMIDGIDRLDQDEDTKVIVLVSKPPVPEVAEKVLQRAKLSAKPIVVCFIADDAQRSEEGVTFASSLEDAAVKAVSIARGEDIRVGEKGMYAVGSEIAQASQGLSSDQRWIRALYCGGTLAAEALHEISKVRPDVRSNVAKKAEFKMSDPFVSECNTVVDLGDDAFTVGRPHPMIEPSLRCERLIAEATDPEVAVVLLDFELGFGSSADPVAATIDAINAAKEANREKGRSVLFIGYVLGTDRDYQDYRKECAMLREAGVLLAQSNLHAVNMALAAIGE